jgi:hypothetical protein
MDLTDFRAKAPALICIPCPGLKPGVSAVFISGVPLTPGFLCAAEAFFDLCSFSEGGSEGTSLGIMDDRLTNGL